MLNLDPAKLLIIAVVAVILLGPDKLPQVARQAGAAWRTFNDFRHRMESEVRSTIPDLPSSHDIARLARSPSALLDHLSNMSTDEVGTASENGTAANGAVVKGASVSGDGVNGDSVTGNSVTGDSVTGDSVTGDSVTGDAAAALVDPAAANGAASNGAVANGAAAPENSESAIPTVSAPESATAPLPRRPSEGHVSGDPGLN